MANIFFPYVTLFLFFKPFITVLMNLFIPLQAVAAKSPGITSLVELLKECIRSFHSEEEDEEEEKDQKQPQHHPHPHRVAPIVKAYTLLCVFPSRVLVEEGDGLCAGGGERGGEAGGFDCIAFVKGLTYLFNVSISVCVCVCVCVCVRCVCVFCQSCTIPARCHVHQHWVPCSPVHPLPLTPVIVMVAPNASATKI